MLSDLEIVGLQSKGVKVNLKDRVQLLPLNREAAEDVALLLPNCRADGTGLFKLDIPSFAFISRLYGHLDTEGNLRKIQGLYADINCGIIREREKKGGKKKVKH